MPSAAGFTGGQSFASTYLINDVLAIDAGVLGFYGEAKDQARVRDVLITHTHADHIASLPIFVENAYFTDDSLLKELLEARKRGVDVRVIVPIVTDRGALTRDNALAANVMLANGIRVFIYPGMSHIKAAIYDGWVCLGSANFDRFSMKINREMNLASSHPPAAQELRERVFEEDFARSPELLVPFPERWSDHLVEVIGDYIF